MRRYITVLLAFDAPDEAVEEVGFTLAAAVEEMVEAEEVAFMDEADRFVKIEYELHHDKLIESQI